MAEAADVLRAAEALCGRVHGMLLDAGWLQAHTGLLSPARHDLYSTLFMLRSMNFCAALPLERWAELEPLLPAEIVASTHDADFVTVPGAHYEAPTRTVLVEWMTGVYHGPGHLAGPIDAPMNA